MATTQKIANDKKTHATREMIRQYTTSQPTKEAHDSEIVDILNLELRYEPVTETKQYSLFRSI